MASVRGDIANAVKASLDEGLAAEAFSQAFTPVRTRFTQRELADFDTLRVTVVPKAWSEALHTRASSLATVEIDVAVQKKLAGDDPAQTDPYDQLVEEILAWFRRKRLTTYPAAAWSASRNDPIYDPGHQLDLRMFTSVVTLTYLAALGAP